MPGCDWFRDSTGLRSTDCIGRSTDRHLSPACIFRGLREALRGRRRGMPRPRLRSGGGGLGGLAPATRTRTAPTTKRRWWPTSGTTSRPTSPRHPRAPWARWRRTIGPSARSLTGSSQSFKRGSAATLTKRPRPPPNTLLRLVFARATRYSPSESLLLVRRLLQAGVVHPYGQPPGYSPERDNKGGGMTIRAPVRDA
eukprot:1194623-Prorocentrum_minimum.AAC.3